MKNLILVLTACLFLSGCATAPKQETRYYTKQRASVMQPRGPMVAASHPSGAVRARDARTGRFVTMEYAKAHPDTTVVERL